MRLDAAGCGWMRPDAAGERRKGSEVHAAVDTLGHLLALVVTPANEQDRAQVATLAGLHFLVFICLMLHQFTTLTSSL
jgi:Transposase DDE domain